MITDPLVIYPAPSANSFVSLTNADAILDYHVAADIWNQESDDNKKRFLIQAYTWILALEGFEAPVAPDPVPGCLDSAQAYTAIQILININEYNDKLVKSEKVGPVATVYQDQEMLDGDRYPEDVVACLEDHGALETNVVGAVGSIKKTRF